MLTKTGKKKEILYVAAFDKNGVLVKAKDADKTQDYFCPECKDRLILKKSGKTGKGSKRPHFAHYSQSPNCKPEGVLHKSFKILLLEKIQNHIANKEHISIEWECMRCHEKYKGNLIQVATDVKEEYQMDNCRADIALLNIDNTPFAVIEIIVTHKPEEAAIEFYKRNKIALIQIELESEDDLDNVDAKLNNPTSIDYCFNRHCPNHAEYTYYRHPVVSKKRCVNFHSMRTFIVEIYHLFGLQRSIDFTDEEIELAKSKGVNFVANKVICPHCRAISSRYRGNIRL
jgi:ribosomal protein L37AE/L43A